MERKQFTFYSGFMDGIKRIKSKSARCDAYDAIIAYALDGTEPDLEKLPDAAAIAFVMAKPNLDASRKRAANALNRTNTEQESNEHRTDIERASKPKQEKEEEKEKEKVKEQLLIKENTKEKRSVRFVPPTLDEVKAYVAEKGYKVDPVAWWHHYDGNGWMCGKTPMKNWKSAIVTWTRSDFGTPPRKPDISGRDQAKDESIRKSFEMLKQWEEEDSA